MSKASLAVKYRPKTFDEVVEQGAVKTILQEQLKTKTFQHCYLLCGCAGCGKTSQARCFANSINNGKGNPVEIDAASNNGVDNVRQIIDDARRKPLDSDYKVFILDEVHMLSTGAWNAMLKLLEEPPKTAIFLMCTTDPQKIPATILSRVQRYDLSKISLDGIVSRLQYILEEENKEGAEYTYTDAAIEYIAKLADGGMRDAITMMDKCLSLNPNLSIQSVVTALGTVDYDTHFDLLMYMEAQSKSSATKIIEDVYNAGKDVKQFVKQFQYFVLDVCKYKMFNDFRYVGIPALEEYKTRLQDEDLELALAVLKWVRELNAEIKWESNPKAIVQTAIVLFNPEE